MIAVLLEQTAQDLDRMGQDWLEIFENFAIPALLALLLFFAAYVARMKGGR